MTLDDLKDKYSNREAAFLNGLPKPNKHDLNLVIEKFGCEFPNSFIDFQFEYCHQVSMGDFAYDGFGWANKDLASYKLLYRKLT